MKAGCSLISLSLPRARVFRREPYVIGMFTTGDTELRVSCEPLLGVKRGRPFIGNVELIEPVELGGDFVAGRLEVWESDADQRSFGERIQRAQQAVEKNRVLAALADSAGTIALGPARIGIMKAAAVIGELLVGARDDRMESFDFDIAKDEIRVGKRFELAGRHAVVKLAVTGSPAPGAEWIRRLLDTEEMTEQVPTEECADELLMGDTTHAAHKREHALACAVAMFNEELDDEERVMSRTMTVTRVAQIFEDWL